MTGKRALVLSGGGAKGAFQAGVLNQLYRRGLTFDLFYGVSVGALNAGVLATYEQQTIGMQQLKEIWFNIKEKDVHHKYSWPKVVWRILWGKSSLYNNRPLLNTIYKHIGESAINKSKVGVVDLVDGHYYIEQGYHSFIFASSTMPIYWEPVGSFVDGGLRNITPLGDAIEAGADEIYVILCNKLPIDPIEKAPDKLLDVALRSLDIAMNEIANGDINQTLLINDLIKQAADKGVTLMKDDRKLRHINVYLIQPSQSLGDTIDFKHEMIVKRFEIGDTMELEL